MNAYDLSKVKATLTTLFAGSGFKCETSTDPSIPDCYFDKPCQEVDATLLDKVFEIKLSETTPSTYENTPYPI